jgi:hypothetical protein
MLKLDMMLRCVRNVCKLHKLHSLECGNYLFNRLWASVAQLVIFRCAVCCLAKHTKHKKSPKVKLTVRTGRAPMDPDCSVSLKGVC